LGHTFEPCSGSQLFGEVMMVARNDITGDAIQTKGVTDAFRDNYDNIFRKNKKTDAEKFDEKVIMKEEHYDQDVDPDYPDK
jgi:hypothetical protein